MDARERALLKRLDGRRSVVTGSGEFVRFGTTTGVIQGFSFSKRSREKSNRFTLRAPPRRGGDMPETGEMVKPEIWRRQGLAVQ